MKHLKKFESFKVNEGFIGTTLLVLTGLGVFYIARKIKRFLDKISLILPLVKIAPFKKVIDNINDNTQVLVENENGIYTITIKDENNNEFDSLVLDIDKRIVYLNKEMKEIIIPTPISPKYKNNEKIVAEVRKLEDNLIEGIIEIINKHSK